jgi:hypothetical protein
MSTSIAKRVVLIDAVTARQLLPSSVLSISTEKIDVLVDLGNVSQLLVVTSIATATVIQCLSAQ